MSRTKSTVSERKSVTDTAIRPEHDGATSSAGWQVGRHKGQGRGFYAGVLSVGETPVPIPNTAVKPRGGYNTWVLTLGR